MSMQWSSNLMHEGDTVLMRLTALPWPIRPDIATDNKDWSLESSRIKFKCHMYFDFDVGKSKLDCM